MIGIHIFLRRILLCSFLALALAGCASSGDERKGVEKALDAFAQELAATPIEASALPSRMRAYLGRNPGFFGSTVTLLDADQKASVSPYVYKAGEGYAEKNLVEAGYDIDSQVWLANARDTKAATWTEPYFDAGGGEIWMITRTAPLIKDGVVYAVVTTDLPTDKP
jgi:sigma-B regulation protein RsbU (phosphoserine phosphatase)